MKSVSGHIINAIIHLQHKHYQLSFLLQTNNNNSLRTRTNHQTHAALIIYAWDVYYFLAIFLAPRIARKFTEYFFSIFVCWIVCLFVYLFSIVSAIPLALFADVLLLSIGQHFLLSTGNNFPILFISFIFSYATLWMFLVDCLRHRNRFAYHSSCCWPIICVLSLQLTFKQPPIKLIWPNGNRLFMCVRARMFGFVWRIVVIEIKTE